jgi:hypothetical protein
MRFTISTIVAGVTGALAGSLLMASAVTGQDANREPVMLDQVVGQEARLAGACKEGQAVAGSLGLSGLACDCTHYLTADRPERNRWEFRSEPTILGVIRGGPADGKLEEGDAIVAIDGQLITTREGGRRFAQVRPDAPVGLTVRRDGRERRVTITAGSRCLSVEPAPVADVAVGVEPELAPAVGIAVRPDTVAMPAPPRRATGATVSPEPALADAEPAAGVGVAAEVAPVADAPPVAGVAVGLPPAPPDVWSSPQGWLGLSFSCTRCGIHVADTGAEGETMSVWEFSTPPVVESVEQDGPAREAGVRAGDAITHIDDVDITSQEGGRRFGRLEPGQEVRLRVERSGRSREVRLRADERPRRDSSRGAAVWSADRADQEDRADRRAPVVPPPDRWEGLANGRRAGTSSEAARFTGLVGDVLIQVTGGPITVEESDTEVVIRSRDITVRISKTDDTKPERP